MRLLTVPPGCRGGNRALGTGWRPVVQRLRLLVKPAPLGPIQDGTIGGEVFNQGRRDLRSKRRARVGEVGGRKPRGLGCLCCKVSNAIIDARTLPDGTMRALEKGKAGRDMVRYSHCFFPPVKRKSARTAYEKFFRSWRDEGPPQSEEQHQGRQRCHVLGALTARRLAGAPKPSSEALGHHPASPNAEREHPHADQPARQ